jgi:hypothetical protein
MLSSSSDSSTIVILLALIGDVVAPGNVTSPCLSTFAPGYVLSPSVLVKITVTLAVFELGPTERPVTGYSGWSPRPVRSIDIVGFLSLGEAGGLTIHGLSAPLNFCCSTEESDVVVVNSESGRSGVLPSMPIRSCCAQRTVVVVPAVVVLVVTVARVVVVATVAAVVDVGGAAVEAVVPAGAEDVAVVFVPSTVVVVPSTVVVLSTVVVVPSAVAVVVVAAAAVDDAAAVVAAAVVVAEEEKVVSQGIRWEVIL